MEILEYDKDGLPTITIAGKKFPLIVAIKGKTKTNQFIDTAQKSESKKQEWYFGDTTDERAKADNPPILIENKKFPNGKWLNITLDETANWDTDKKEYLRFNKKNPTLAGAWDEIVKANKNKIPSSQQITQFTKHIAPTKTELAKAGKEVNMAGVEGTKKKPSKAIIRIWGKKSSLILNAKVTLDKAKSGSRGVKQSDDFHAMYGLMDDAEKVEGTVIVKEKGKSPKEVELNIDPAIQTWKKNWLFRDEPTKEKTTSPKILWKILMRLKKGESRPASRGEYYTDPVNADKSVIDLFLRIKTLEGIRMMKNLLHGIQKQKQ